MLQFSKDKTCGEWPKPEMLARSIASYRHASRYFDPDCLAPLVIQCADGIAQDIQRDWPGPRIAIIHDWNSAYWPVVTHAREVFCIGEFDHPDFGKKCHDIPSYPLDVGRLQPLPTCREYDAVIGGAIRKDTLETLKDVIFGNAFRRVALICYAEQVGATSAFTEIETFLVQRGVEVVFGRRRLPPRLVEDLYLSAPAIVHLGHGCRGWLHTLAEYSRRMTNANVYCEKEFGNGEIVDVRKFGETLDRAADRLLGGNASVD